MESERQSPSPPLDRNGYSNYCISAKLTVLIIVTFCDERKNRFLLETQMLEAVGESINRPQAPWAAILAIATGAFALVTSELLPVGLLPGISHDMAVTEGVAGFMVMVPGLVAAIAALLTLEVARDFDRRLVMCALLVLLAASNAVVAISESYLFLIVGRILLGVAIGAFWTVGASLGPRLRSGDEGKSATNIIFSGISLGTVAGVPAGAVIGALVGWRQAFWLCAALALTVTLALTFLMPSVRPKTATGLRILPTLIRRSRIRIGIAALIFGIGGQFSAYTYIAPFLSSFSGVGADSIGEVLLAYGVAAFLGNLAGGWAAAKAVRTTLVIVPFVLGCAIALLCLANTNSTIAIGCVVLWGFSYGAMPVAMLNWMLAA
ncbi:putative MFS family arabinose efflux permease [Bradyrhizobium sp. USDA 4449]